MWLPKDERKVLAYYYKELHKSGVKTRGQIFLSKLEKCLSKNNKRNRVKIASKMLKQRDLLDFFNDQNEAVTVQLSLEGYDLGRKYSKKRGMLWIWCNEYKLWVILTVITGLIGLIVTILVAIKD
ncbi:hypothetical protein ES703_99472 [subsurface metagenome]